MFEISNNMKKLIILPWNKYNSDLKMESLTKTRATSQNSFGKFFLTKGGNGRKNLE